MEFVIDKVEMKKNFIFVCDMEEYKGVKKISKYISQDFEKVFGYIPKIKIIEDIDKINEKNKIVFGTIGKSNIVDKMIENNEIDVAEIAKKRECYKFILKNNSEEDKILYIVGSDKRGTIYGLFKLSEIIGISPFVNWCDVEPEKKEKFIIEDVEKIVSKEPSVKYRGFFINDEWPAFGTWVTQHFGGFTVEAYEKIFELLLRMKGNYLWPAMWSSRFSEDGPGLENAKLADEMGIIMGMSHHEPCLRHGEEYKYLRGKNSIYGDAWNFITNKDGITKFWEDGLRRSGKFENVITVGMRGEADSTILGKEATLKDNIDLLKDVLQTQNKLIKENVNKDLEKVPRMLALYKEVEPFFYGDENTKGLMNSKELEGVTLMLCDDNHGNLRTLPSEEMKKHNGGYGMYYHFDYHGSPVSYEWVNSSSLYKTWEQMTTAYEAGIRELWIVNVGDIFSNEYPLSFFLDLAYDYEKWGINNLNSPKEYTKLFVENIFGQNNEFNIKVENLLESYTKIAHSRRPESLNANVYAPMCYGEREELYNKCEKLMSLTEKMYENCSKRNKFPFYEFVYYPVMANLNLQCMWLDTTYNNYLAKIGASMAMKIAEKVTKRIDKDYELIEELHMIQNKKWYGMGLSEHIGFKNWNEEECQYPILHTFRPSNKARIIAVVVETGEHSEGSEWTKKRLVVPDFIRYETDKAYVDLYSTSSNDANFKITYISNNLEINMLSGTVKKEDKIRLIITKRENEDNKKVGNIHIQGEYMELDIDIPFATEIEENLKGKNTYIFNDDYICIEAGNYTKKEGTGKGEFKELLGFGKFLSGMKAFPVEKSFELGKDAPSLCYEFVTQIAGEYNVTLYCSPSNPPYKDNKLLCGIACNDGNIEKINLIPENFKIVDNNKFWSQSAIENIRLKTFSVNCEKGLNKLKVYAISPEFVLEKIVISKENTKIAYAYYGPKETMRIF